jgi:two-component system chemotaxis response regulator CheY
MRILLADDSLAMRTSYRRVLEKLGHSSGELTDVKDGRELLRVLQTKSSPVELIVFDWDLPGLDGLALMTHLKSIGQIGQVSVLLSVSRQQRALAGQAARLGPCESIERPFTDEALAGKFRALVRAIGEERNKSTKRPGSLAPAPESASAMPFLVRLRSTVIDDLLKLADERRHEAGSILLRTGQICDALHIVTRGQVEILRAGGGVAPVREGDPFGEFSFMMSEPSTYSVRANTVAMTTSLSKSRISDLLRKHPSLDAEFSSLLGRHREAMTSRATTIIQSDFKGTFDTLPFANVIQILCIGRKSGVLGIRQEEQSGGIYLDGGEAVHAWTDELKGEAAFRELSRWTRAKFAFNSIRREEERTLHKPTITLLMEALGGQGDPTPPPEAAKDVGLDTLFPSA